MSGGSLRCLLMKRSNSSWARLGVHLGHVQAVADRRIGGRAPALAKDFLAARKAHDVVHRQEVHLVAALGDQPQLVHQLPAHLPGNTRRIAPARPFHGELPQRLRGRHAPGHGFHRVLVLDGFEAEIAARGHHQRVGQQLRRIDAAQPHARAQVALGVCLQGQAAFVHGFALPHRGDHVLQRPCVSARACARRPPPPGARRPPRSRAAGCRSHSTSSRPSSNSTASQVREPNLPLAHGGDLHRISARA